MIHVRTGIKRPSPDIIAGYRELSSATVHEASGRKGAVDPAINQYQEGSKSVGLRSLFSVHPATISCSTRRLRRLSRVMSLLRL